MACIAEGGEHSGHRVVDQEVAVGEEQDLGTTILTTAVPAAVPQLPADLESDAGLAGTCGERGQNAFLPEQNRLDDALNGDCLLYTSRCV